MKTVFQIYFLLLLTLGCTGQQQNKTPINKDSIATDTSFKQTLHFYNSHNQDALIEEIKKVTSSPFPDFKIEIKKTVRLNERTFYVVYELHDGVSLTSYLMTFLDNKFKDYETLERFVDQDFSSPHYEYTELKDNSDSNYTIINYSQEPADKNVLTADGHFKADLDFESVKIKTDSTIISLIITSYGTIKRDTVK